MSARIPTEPRLRDFDGVYVAIVDGCRDLDESGALRFFARLSLILANAIGDDAAVREAVRLAREAADDGRPAGSGT